MCGPMRPIIKNYIDTAHFFNNLAQEFGISLGSYAALVRRVDTGRASRINIDTENRCLSPQVFPKYL